MTLIKPLLTISIPTFNRAIFLEKTLSQIIKERIIVGTDLIEIIVSNNCSSDDTEQTVKRLMTNQPNFRYIRNKENIGSDHNIAQCFNEAMGTYVLILGDDDMPCDGVLETLCRLLRDRSYGVVYLRAYGYERDMRREYPGGQGKTILHSDANEFLSCIAQALTFISSLVINKDLLKGTDAHTFCGGNLVQVHLVLLAALQAQHNLYISRYSIAATRNNSAGDKNFTDVFVKGFFNILDSFRAFGLSENAIQTIEKRMILTYYPLYLLQMRQTNAVSCEEALNHCSDRFSKRWLYWVLLAPIMRFPRNMAVCWGLTSLAIGRVAGGDLRRGFFFILHKVCKNTGRNSINNQ